MRLGHKEPNCILCRETLTSSMTVCFPMRLDDLVRACELLDLPYARADSTTATNRSSHQWSPHTDGDGDADAGRGRLLASILTNRSSLPLLQELMVTRGDLLNGQLWRLVTAPFATVEPLGFLVSLMVLGFFGAQVEARLGSRGLATLLLVTAIAGGLIQAAVGFEYWGFRGAGYSMLAAFAAIAPKAQVLLLVFPVPAWLLVAILVFIDIATAIGHAGGESVLGHLAGVGTGLVAILGQPTIARWKRQRRQRQAQRSEQRDADDNAELDRLLEKVSSQGLHSLTKSERSFLDRCSKQRKERED